MARERYLWKVSEDELRPDPKQEQTYTPRSWLDNIWYHYKFGILISGFLLVVLTVLIVQAVTRVHPDYTAVLVTETAVFPQELSYLEQTLAEYGQDINKDGKVVVQISNLQLGGNVYANQNTNAQALQLRLITGDTLLYIYEPMYEKRLNAVGGDKNQSYLSDLPFDSEGLSEDKHSWDWVNHSRRKQDAFLQAFPKELRFSIRRPKPEDQKSDEQHAQVMALLEAFIADRKTAQ